MSVLDAAQSADIEAERQRLTAAHPWFGGISGSRQRALAEIAATQLPFEAEEIGHVMRRAARDEWAMASATLLMSRWADRAGQVAWRVAHALRSGSDDPRPKETKT